VTDLKNDEQSGGVGPARAVLWVFLTSSVAVAGWRAYEAAVRVRPELRLEFLVKFVGFPILLAAVTALALRWLRTGYAGGAGLGAAILAYGSTKAALLAWSGGGSGLSTGTEQSVGVAVQVMIAIGLMLLAARLGVSAYGWARSSRRVGNSVAAEQRVAADEGR
jgi:hypothetical protein